MSVHIFKVTFFFVLVIGNRKLAVLTQLIQLIMIVQKYLVIEFYFQ